MSNSNMENLHTDILEEILFRLCVTVHAKRVCTTWRALLRNKREEGLLFAFGKEKAGQLFYGNECDHYDRAKMIKMRLKMEHDHRVMVGSCNGLVCIGKRDKDVFTMAPDPFRLCNPLTGEYVRLPKFKLTGDLASDGIYGRKLASGFGYCHSTKEYKVVRIYSQMGRLRSVQVYTIGGKWRCIKSNISYFNCSSSGIYANGFLYWLNCPHSIKPQRENIVAFDLKREKFFPVPMPTTDAICLSHPRGADFLLGGNKKLHLVHTENNCTDIWACKFKRKSSNTINSSNMKKSHWIKLCSIKGEAAVKLKPFAITRNNEVLLWYKSEFIYCYDPKTSIPNGLWDGKGMGCPNIEVIPHMPSNVSLKDLGETDVRSYTSARAPTTLLYYALNI